MARDDSALNPSQAHVAGVSTTDPPLRIRVYPSPLGAEARFGLVLSGVSDPFDSEGGSPGRASAKPRLVLLSPPALEPGEGIDLIYRIEGGKLQTHIRGRARAASRGEAMEKAAALWANLEVALEPTRSIYAFTPAGEDLPLTNPEFRFHLRLEPVGYRISGTGRGAIGFISNISEAGAPLLVDQPFAREPRPFDTVVHAAVVCRSRTEVRVALDHAALDPGSLAAIESALAKLRGSEHIAHADEGRRPVHDRRVLIELEAQLTRWQRSRRGYRLRVTVSSDDPPPATLLTLLGAEVYQGRDLTWRMDSANTRSPATARRHPRGTQGPFVVDNNDSLDLRGYIPAGAPIGLPLPSVGTLRRAGIPRLFPDRVDHLPEEGILLGHVGHGDRTRPVRFSESDRGRHCYLLGATGTGKSTLLFNMVRQDIRAGSGVCLLDPHADLTEQILDAIPPERLDDLILFDPADPERAVGLNFLETDGDQKARQMNFITNEMIRIFNRLYDMRVAGGPVFEQYMRNALLLLMDNDLRPATLVDLPRLFEDHVYRKALLARCRSPHVVSFWTRQAERAGGDVSLSNMGPYITSKLNQFTHNAILRPIIGQTHSTIDFRACMDEGKILLVRLSKGQLGAMDTQLLGMLVIGKLFDAALSRGSLPQSERRPFHLYVDEAQNFVTDTVAELLSEARKFGLHLTLANQNLSQMTSETDIVGSLLGNVGSLLLFRLGVLDAERLASFMRPEISAGELQDLPNFHVAARLLVDGRPSRAFVFQTQGGADAPQDATRRSADRQRINELRANYTREIREVEAELGRWQGASKPEA